MSKAICKENKYGNTNFILGKTYEMSGNKLRCECGGMWIESDKEIEVRNNIFHIGMCEFEKV